MSLYQKYRPNTFDDLVGQSFVRQALTAALASRKTVGSYLFCGSRGTGKTSVARILAKAINCLALGPDGNPCGSCLNCIAASEGSMIDIIEIDGASNNGVANIRELIERARFQPSMWEYKIYIIDEVHMLSSWAFNALLKILEEPPSHVKFILATTESHKIPETIISRSQRYDFRKISEQDIIARLTYVATAESITTHPAALALIARLARGGLRDALSLFEQYTIAGTLSYDFLCQNLSILGEDFMDECIDEILSNDTTAVVSRIEVLRSRSLEPRRFADDLLRALRSRGLERVNTPDFVQIWQIFKALSGEYPRLRELSDGYMLLEMTLLGIMQCWGGGATSPGASTKTIASQDPIAPPIAKVSVPLMPPVPTPPSQAESSQKIEGGDAFVFTALVEHVKNTPKKWVLLNVLKTGTFKYASDPAIFTLIARTEFDRSQLDTPEIRDYLATTIEELFGIRSQIVLSAGWTPATMHSSKDKPATLGAIADIF